MAYIRQEQTLAAQLSRAKYNAKGYRQLKFHENVFLVACSILMIGLFSRRCHDDAIYAVV